MTEKDQPRRRRLKFVTGLEPGPAFIESELSFEEICERYLTARRAGAEEIEQAAEQGSGDQAAGPAKPALPDDKPDPDSPRRRPGQR